MLTEDGSLAIGGSQNGKHPKLKCFLTCFASIDFQIIQIILMLGVKAVNKNGIKHVLFDDS